MSYEIHGEYDVRWSNGQVSTVSGIGVLLRTLANYPDAEPDWSALSESDTTLARSIVDARAVNPPPKPSDTVRVESYTDGSVALTITNGQTHRTARMSCTEAHDLAAALMGVAPAKVAS